MMMKALPTEPQRFQFFGTGLIGLLVFCVTSVPPGTADAKGPNDVIGKMRRMAAGPVLGDLYWPQSTAVSAYRRDHVLRYK